MTAIDICVVCECTDDTKVNQCGCVCHVPTRLVPDDYVSSLPWDRRKSPREVITSVDRRMTDRLELWER